MSAGIDKSKTLVVERTCTGGPSACGVKVGDPQEKPHLTFDTY